MSNLRANSREIWGWAFYDFANSAYSTAIVVIFNVYFVQVVVGPDGLSFLGMQVSGSAIWGYAASTSMLLVALSAPVLGAIADFKGSKKRNKKDLLSIYAKTGKKNL